ncbi:energy-coupling factor ABC transporter ATP-binding protein [Lentilactobacillus kefiri]|uniref:Energy-coupling factor transporter ATP-binding protein EcfA2 n=2 Tax=Lentilactobacillus kefiri TaxID=33962 RepID=A0A8E1RHC0_LENKE|nr:energy-coupling factor ABC transporter ATP-binding protein [Lentilactobacillus kefiri]KRL62242.1 Fe(3+)-transporting ATPase [Lentilactobacillus parakefiri DSM 10551]KRM49515.1 Fe(3+)-transporting ATPase [Lentilactobacillus kefiri DSM 20587 = JCM 5818]MCJ2162253.1 energy-coupling factor ABC transporter ATP-binding protein [Lentilactobacillus kefiri]MCP9368614.1 energy-coupling factor ABC transporter ATP-binding protein [Lentilactobacillus kefiri]MDH5107654.1 energy-coupling factor ABC transp
MDQEISFNQVTHTYQADTPFAQNALDKVSLKIAPNSFTAIIGHTGSGKSTLVQHINALLKSTFGEIEVYGRQITPSTTNKNLKQLRKHVGMVFQFPEKQLFEESVIKDIMFGPKNYGASDADAEKSAVKAMKLVGLDASLRDQSPFDLSGGQMRRVAIAGVLAMNPEILILDEPTAGLDPHGHKEIMDLAQGLHDHRNMTIILVTHQMDDVVDYASDVIVMDRGQVVKHGTPSQIFADPKWVYKMHLDLPSSGEFATRLIRAGVPLEKTPLTIENLADEIVHLIQGGNHTDE